MVGGLGPRRVCLEHHEGAPQRLAVVLKGREYRQSVARDPRVWVARNGG